MKEEIKIPTGLVVGIGKIKVFKTKQFPHNIPTLSFIVAKEGESYTASCLHLLLDATAKNENDAINSLRNVCCDFLSDLFSSGIDSAWEQLHELFTTDCVNEFWAGYRDCQLNLAEKGIDTSDSIIKSLTKRIKELKAELAQYEDSKKEIEIDVVEYDQVNKAVA